MVVEAELEEQNDQFVRLIVEDVIHAKNWAEQHSSGESQRNYVRALVAGIEGMAWHYRDEVVDIASTLELLTKQEAYALETFSYSIDDSGRLKRQRQHPSASGMIRFSARLVERICPGTHHDFGVAFWEKIQFTIKVRNGITHPKTVLDLDVSTFDICAAHDAFVWLTAFMVSDLESIVQALRNHIDDMNHVMDRLRSGDPKMTRRYKAIFKERPD